MCVCVSNEETICWGRNNPQSFPLASPILQSEPFGDVSFVSFFPLKNSSEKHFHDLTVDSVSWHHSMTPFCFSNFKLSIQCAQLRMCAVRRIYSLQSTVDHGGSKENAEIGDRRNKICQARWVAENTPTCSERSRDQKVPEKNRPADTEGGLSAGREGTACRTFAIRSLQFRGNFGSPRGKWDVPCGIVTWHSTVRS